MARRPHERPSDRWVEPLFAGLDGASAPAQRATSRWVLVLGLLCGALAYAFW